MEHGIIVNKKNLCSVLLKMQIYCERQMDNAKSCKCVYSGLYDFLKLFGLLLLSSYICNAWDNRNLVTCLW